MSHEKGKEAKAELSLKDFSPEERAEILAIALRKGWNKEQINQFLEKVSQVHAGYRGKYSIKDILSRAKDLSDPNETY